jgi:hypothetical protein
LKSRDVVKYLKQQLQRCAGWDQDEIASDRVSALNYYFQRKRGDEIAGRSQLVSGDLSAMTDACLSQILDAFSDDNIIEFDSLGPEDEDQAQLESDTVVHFVMKEQNGLVQLAAAIKNALLLRNGFVKCWIDETKVARTRDFENVEPEALSVLVQPPPNVELDVQKYDPDKKTLRLRITKTAQKFRCESVDPANFFYPKDWDSFELQDIPICGERHVEARSELVRRGFPAAKVEKLKPYNPDMKSDSRARNVRRLVTPRTPSIDPSQDQIEWFETYVLLDRDGDGIAERRCICFSYQDNVELSDEPADIVSYGAGAVIINPQRLTGISLYDKLRQNQDERTALKRARADNINTVTKQRLAYLDGKVNVDDVSDGRPNGGIRVKANVGDIRAAVMPFQVPDTSGPISAALADTAGERTEMGGAALELASGNAQIGGDRMGSQGLDRAYSVMEQLSAMMAKNIAITLIRSVFLLAHATLRANINTPVPLKRNGKWFSPVPSQWQPRTRITVKVGMSPGERARKAAALWQLLQAQINLAGQGMDEVLVDLEGFYSLLLDWARVVGIKNPERYFVDPTSDSAKAALQSKANAAAAQKKMQQQLMTQAVQLEQMRVGLEKYSGDADRQFKYWNAVLGAEVEEAKIAGSATVSLLTAKKEPTSEPNKERAGKGAAEKPAAA